MKITVRYNIVGRGLTIGGARGSRSIETESAMSQQLARHHFTAEQYERMGELGVLPANKNFELIEGEIIEMSPIGSHHAAWLT